MRIVQINSVPNLSTGSVMLENHKRYLAEGHESWRMWGRGRAPENEYEYKFNSDMGVNLDALQTRMFGKAGFYSKAATKRLLAKLDEINPDMVHLHNIHGYYLNVEMLFRWLKGHNCKVEWTLHDCWAFTGHCSHFINAKCEQWKLTKECSADCPQLCAYPKTISRNSVEWNYKRKRTLFTCIPADRMLLITPSAWLANLVKESFLSDYPIEVRHNTIDTNVFAPTSSGFREKNGLVGKYIILGVASAWGKSKGLEDFVRLSDLVNDQCAIVLVGIAEEDRSKLPKKIISLGRTGSKRELAEIYSAADIFFNPTKQDNYPTVNLEAEACGTRVICYDTGGCRETLRREDSLIVDGFDSAWSIIKKDIELRNGKKRP